MSRDSLAGTPGLGTSELSRTPRHGQNRQSAPRRDVYADDANRELIQAIRVEGRPTYGTGRLRRRYRRCHEIAFKALLGGKVPEGTLLVQGIERNREHSWLELPDGGTWDPVTCLPVTDVQQVTGKYTPAEACAAAEVLGAIDHFAAWGI